MEAAFFVLLILVVWISLYNHIGKVSANIESLKKEIDSLRKQLEGHPVAEKEKKKENAVSPAKPVEEEYHIPILSVEVKPDDVLPHETPVTLETPEMPKPQAPKRQRKPVNYEKYIGENLFGKIGILILVVGVGLFVKYAIDKDWINEVFRTVLGFLVGGGLCKGNRFQL